MFGGLGGFGGFGGGLGGFGGLFGGSGGDGGGGLMSSLGPVFQFMGTERQNYLNAREAEKNRMFQMLVAKHGYRWTMEDMYKAGLNPMLAANLGGNKSAPGSMAHMENSIGAAASSVREFSMNQATIDNIRADTLKKQAETINTNAQTTFTSGAQTEKAIADMWSAYGSANLSNQQGENLRQQIPLIAQQIELSAAQARSNNANASATELENTARQIESDIYKAFPLIKQLDVVGNNAMLKNIKDAILRAPSYTPPTPKSKTYKDSRGRDVIIDYNQ